MTVSLKHAFTSAKADGPDTTLVRPSNWNAEHTLTCASGKVLGRATTGVGAVEELAAGSFGRSALATADLTAFLALLTQLSTAGDFSVGGAAAVTGTFAVTGATTLTTLTATTGVFSGVVTQSSTSHGVLPTGTTAQRPGSPEAGHYRYNTTLGNFEFYNGATWAQPSIAQPIAGGFRNLVIANNATTPNTQIDLSADAVTVETSSGIAYRLSSLAVTINAVSTGANALDTGAVTTDTWYYVYAIYNPTTQTAAGLISTSSTSPTLPSGYTARARLGAFRTDGSTHFQRIKQVGNVARYLVSSGRPRPLVALGQVGSVTTPSWVAASVSPVVPPTAVLFEGISYSHGGYNIVSPNNAHGAYNDLYYCPPVDHSGVASRTFQLLLESTDIYWASQHSWSNIQCAGWTDNI